MKHKQYIAGSGGCFIAGTTVHTPSGYKLIEDLLVGDIVTSFNDRGELRSNPVLKVHVHENEDTYKYTLWGGNELIATPNHHVLTSENYFCDIGSINESLSLVNTSNLFVPIVSSEYNGKHTVYNITVQFDHTYIANDIRVHNGGGGKGSRTPVDSPDNLKSTSFANIIDLLCEGEIEGFAKKDSAECIYINSLPLKNPNGTLNYTEFEYALNKGTPTQDYLPGFESVESSGIGTASKIVKDVPKVINIPTGVADRVRLTLGIPALVHYQDNGDTTGSEISYKVEISRENGAYTEVVNKTFTGKTTSRYQFSHIIILDKLDPSDEFNIRITRITPDSTSQKLQNDLWYDTHTLLTDTKLNYPHSAHIGVKIASTQFSSIPSRGYHLKMLKVKLPSNYTPGGSTYEIKFNTVSDSVIHLEHGLPNNTKLVVTNFGQTTGLTKTDTYYIVNSSTNAYQLSLSPSGPTVSIGGTDGSGGNILTLADYDGIWDGNLTNYAWTNNPAWCFYDLITSKRYGLGEYITEDLVDKWSLYSIAQYCDELVPDGYGGMEPRFALNVYIQSKEDAIKVLSDMASAFRAMLFYSNAVITLAQDSNTGASDVQFTNSNVVDGIFTYSGASRKTIHTAALVSWNDPRSLYTQKIEYVEDRDAIERYGYNPSELLAFGCTSKGQANRLGKWLLYTENVESNIVSFKSGLEGSYCRPGDIVKIYDEYLIGLPNSGRIISKPNNTTLVLDKGVMLPGGSTYKLRVTTLEEASGIESFNTQEYTITTVSATPINTISVSTNLDSSISSNFIWSINSTSLTESLYRIISVKEADDLGVYEISALKHKPGKFDYIELGIQFDDDRYTNLTGIPSKIPYEDISYTQGLLQDSNGTYSAYIDISWKDQLYASTYIVELKHLEGNWETIADTSSLSYTINNLMYDNYYSIRLTPVNSSGIKGPSTTFTDIYIYLRAEALEAPSLITHVLKDGYIRFEWEDSGVLDNPNFAYYEVTLGETYETSLLGYSSIRSDFLDYYTAGMVDDNSDGTYKFWFVTTNKIGIKSTPLLYSITVANADPITGLTATGALQSIVLNWVLPIDTEELVSTEIWASTTNNRASAVLLSGIAIPGTNFLHSITNPTQLSYYYWGRTKNVLDSYSEWYPLSATAGVFGEAQLKDPLTPVVEISGFTGFSVNAGGLITPETATLVANIEHILNPTYLWAVNPSGCLVPDTENPLSNPTTNTIIIRPLSNTTSIYVSVTVDGDDSNGFPLEEPVVRDYTFPVVYSGAPGQAGQHGIMSAFPSIYIWTATNTPPTRPTVSSVYTWTTGAYSAPAGWYTSAPQNLTPSSVLWRITVPMTVSATTITSTLDWTNPVYEITSVARNGATGPVGPAGPPGTNGNNPVSFILSRADLNEPSNAEVQAKLGRPPMVGDLATVKIGNSEYRVYEYLPSGWIQQVLRINGSLIVENTITANRLSVTDLSSISANIGHITAGFIDGVTINSSFLTRHTDDPTHNYFTYYMRKEYNATPANIVATSTGNTSIFSGTTGSIFAKAYNSAPTGYSDSSYLNRFKSSIVPLSLKGTGTMYGRGLGETKVRIYLRNAATNANIATILDTGAQQLKFIGTPINNLSSQFYGIQMVTGYMYTMNGVTITTTNPEYYYTDEQGNTVTANTGDYAFNVSGTYDWTYITNDVSIKVYIEIETWRGTYGAGKGTLELSTSNHNEYA